MGKKTSETKITGPWKPLRAPMTDVIGRAQTLSNEKYYADPNENVSDAFNRMIAMGQDPQSGVALGAKAYGQTAAGDFLDPESNPWLRKSYEMGSQGVLDSINAEFSKAGRYGSEAHQSTLQKGLNDLATQIYGGAYDSERNRMMMAQMNPLGSYSDIMMQLQGGQGLTALDQQQMDDPRMALMQYLQMLQGVGNVPMGQKTTQSGGWLQQYMQMIGAGADAASTAMAGA